MGCLPDDLSALGMERILSRWSLFKMRMNDAKQLNEDGKIDCDRESKAACSCRFTRHSWGGPSGICMTPHVCFVLFCFVYCFALYRHLCFLLNETWFNSHAFRLLLTNCILTLHTLFRSKLFSILSNYCNIKPNGVFFVRILCPLSCLCIPFWRELSERRKIIRSWTASSPQIIQNLWGRRCCQKERRHWST